MRIHIVVNPGRQDAVEAAIEAIRHVQTHGHEVATEVESAELLGATGIPKKDLAQGDLIITFGGDGTLIRAAEFASEFRTPILGVYFGRFGFVTQCQPAEVAECLEAFYDGRARFEDRMMLQVELLRNDQPVATLHALNEVTLQRAVDARMLAFGVEVDGHFLTSYPADGVVLSTPTGSTAYNLSVGGPIVDPKLHAIVLAAMAPHTLSARPFVLQATSEIVLRVQTVGDAILSADSHTRLHLLSGDAARISRSPRMTRLMSVNRNDFLLKLGERLLWSQSILGNRL